MLASLFRYFEVVILLLCLLHHTSCITPTAEMKIRQKSDIIYMAPGSFGASLSSESDTTFRKLVKPTGDTDGCDPTVPHLPHNSNFYLLVSRGNCSFVEKAIAAEAAGAKGLVIYNSLEGIYQGNDYASESDYECDNGSGYVSELIYPLYSDEMTAAMPTECTGHSNCDSGRCVVTNTTTSEGTLVCCAWDLYMTMGDSGDYDVPDIPAVFIRMQDVDTLDSMPELDKLTLDVTMFTRSSPVIDFASVLIWLIATATVTVGACRAAEEDKVLQFVPKNTDNIPDESEDDASVGSRGSTTRRLVAEIPTSTASLVSASHDSSSVRSRDGILGGFSNSTGSHHHSHRFGSGSSVRDFEPAENENSGASLDITPYHAVGFVIVSSCFLLLLYFIDLYFFVTIMYLVSAALACTLIFFYPFFRGVGKRLNAMRLGIRFDNSNDYITLSDTFLDIPFCISGICALSIAVVWYFETDSSWVWLLQDFMGISVCIMFLAAVRLPNLKTATILLGLAFFYDVFFVFISPYIFDSSVMVEVATGPTTEHDDENFCEKYPSDETCQSTELPMLLVVPTFSSYLSTESMLGLGDIVLPGLLLVWTARLDIRRYGSLSSENASKGYFPMAVYGYAVGLLAANIAVEYFQTGQPALLYIVPLTLGSVLIRSFTTGSLPDLWKSLPAMKLVAMPLCMDEREALLSHSDVIETVASWKNDFKVVALFGGQQNNSGVGVLGNAIDSDDDEDDDNEDGNDNDDDDDDEVSFRNQPVRSSNSSIATGYTSAARGRNSVSRCNGDDGFGLI